ncbi:MAG: DUF4426 domain-containing protein [Bdellovibrio bacteriovorus]
MYHPIRLTTAILAAVGLVSSLPAMAAEHSTQAGQYTIHHNAFTADTLSPDVARAYGFQRSKHRGLLNVSVVKEQPGTTGTSTPAAVDVAIVNITGQKSPIPMREIKDQEAVYYLGEFPVYNQQTINFEIQVKPQGDGEFHSVKMSQEFFTD